MQIVSNSDSVIMGLIQHINTLDDKTRELCALISNITTQNPNAYCSSGHDMIDKLGCICKCTKSIDQLLMVVRSELQFFEKYNIGVIKALLTRRQELFETIQKRRETEVQMNTMGQMYDESNLITQFDIIPCNDAECSIDARVHMTELTESKDYSVLSIVKRFESENILYDIEELTRLECNRLNTKFNDMMSNIQQMRDMCSDSTFYMCVSEDDNECKQKLSNLENMVVRCDMFISYAKHIIPKMFRMYQELLHNYDVYSKAVDTYTSFALECFFNSHSQYEF